MPRHLFKQYAPDHKMIREHKYLRVFGTLLHSPNLWHLNKRSISGAFAVGLFWAMIPMPFQMIPAAACAIAARVNLPLSVALVWISNPLTMPPMFYFNYLVGETLLPHHQPLPDMQMSLEWLMNSLGEIWQPLYLGSIVVGLGAGSLGYVGIRLFWRWHVLRQYRLRHSKRKRPASN